MENAQSPMVFASAIPVCPVQAHIFECLNAPSDQPEGQLIWNFQSLRSALPLQPFQDRAVRFLRHFLLNPMATIEADHINIGNEF